MPTLPTDTFMHGYHEGMVNALTHVRAYPGNIDIMLEQASQKLAELQANKIPTELGNTIARDGVDVCPCGSKYWENNICIDCSAHVTQVRRAMN